MIRAVSMFLLLGFWAGSQVSVALADNSDAVQLRRLGEHAYDAKHFTEATQFYEKAVNAGDIIAARHLGYCYENGLGVSKDYQKALQNYRFAAERGDPGAQTHVGYMYDAGLGVVRDIKMAISWYEKAAAADDAQAQWNLAQTYFEGDGVPVDYVKAIDFAKRAAEHGFGNAENLLG